MDKKKIPLNAYLGLAAAVLFITFIVSLFNKPGTDTRKGIKTALINPKYVQNSQIDSITIKGDKKTLELKNNSGIWEIVDFENPYIHLPADSSRINKMISELSSVITAYKVSSKKADTFNYGFEENAFEFTFSSNNSELFTLAFGKMDFTQTKRYVKSSSSVTVYEISDFMGKYLFSSIQNWSEPFIISQQILGAIKPENIQRVIIDNKSYTSSDSEYSAYVSKLLELRHGGIKDNFPYDENNCEYTVKLELGNKDSILLQVFVTPNEGEYLLKTQYLKDSENKKSVYYSNISSWTYSRLKYKQN